jgi:hypothetical protein
MLKLLDSLSGEEEAILVADLQNSPPAAAVLTAMPSLTRFPPLRPTRRRLCELLLLRRLQLQRGLQLRVRLQL